MRVLEALKILEDATLDCKIRDINTPEVRTALEVLQPYCRPTWRITGFCDHLQHGEQRLDGEGQQQVLRVYFGGIYQNVRELFSSQINRLIYRLSKQKTRLLNGNWIGSNPNWNIYLNRGISNHDNNSAIITTAGSVALLRMPSQ